MMISELIDRKVLLRRANPAAHVKQRIAQAAEDLNRAGLLQSQCEVANEAVCKFCTMLYQRDSDGVWANIDNRTGRLLVPSPWGNAGWKHWGLRQWEAIVLRSVLMARFKETKQKPLFDYSDVTRSWYLNANDFPTSESAHAYLHRRPVSLSEWRQHGCDYHKVV